MGLSRGNGSHVPGLWLIRILRSATSISRPCIASILVQWSVRDVRLRRSLGERAANSVVPKEASSELLRSRVPLAPRGLRRVSIPENERSGGGCSLPSQMCFPPIGHPPFRRIAPAQSHRYAAHSGGIVVSTPHRAGHWPHYAQGFETEIDGFRCGCGHGRSGGRGRSMPDCKISMWRPVGSFLSQCCTVNTE